MTEEQAHPSERFCPDTQDPQNGLSPNALLRYADDVRDIPIEVRDISASGAGLIISEAPRLNAVMTLTLTIGDETRTLQARTRWTRQIDQSQWRIGCTFCGSFDSPLSAIGTQRERTAASIPVVVRRQLAPEHRLSGRVTNQSGQGLCIATSNPFSVSEHLLVEPQNKEFKPCVVQVHWSRQCEDGYLTGCRLIGACRREQEIDSDTEEELLAEPARPLITATLNATVHSLTRRIYRSAAPGTWAACLLMYGLTLLQAIGWWPPGR